ncbi:MAG: hypothetical protein AAF921_17580 [Cyanobacteria bacterium P01_D01_bin.44]
MVVPKRYGGIGASWPIAIDTVKTLAQVDSSAAQLYGYHLLLSVVPHLIGTTEQAARHYRDTAQNQLYGYDQYWRNLRTLSLHDPLDYKLLDIGNWVVNGAAPVPSSYA